MTDQFSPAPGEEPVPGADDSLGGGLRLAAATLPFRYLVVLALMLLVGLVAALRPVGVRTVGVSGTVFESQCGISYHVFGGPSDAVTDACREAFAPRAAGAGLIVIALVGVATLLASIVQYWRGYSLGRLWERAENWRSFLIGTSAVTASTVVVAVALSTQAASNVPRDEFVAAPVPTTPVSGFTDDTIVPDPGFATDAEALLERTPPPTRQTGPRTSPTAPAPPTTSPAPPPTAEPAATTTSTTTTAPPTPLVVTASAWYAASPSPIDSVVIPEGSLPVAASGGGDAKHAFFRVTGTENALVFAEGGGVGASQSPESAKVQACPVQAAGWEPAEGGSFDEEPTYSTSGCVAVERQSNGTWRVDLGSFLDRGGDRGFALVPASTDDDWQVVLVPPTA